jgi:hypothetical protein
VRRPRGIVGAPADKYSRTPASIGLAFTLPPTGGRRGRERSQVARIPGEEPFFVWTPLGHLCPCARDTRCRDAGRRIGVLGRGHHASSGRPARNDYACQTVPGPSSDVRPASATAYTRPTAAALADSSSSFDLLASLGRGRLPRPPARAHYPQGWRHASVAQEKDLEEDGSRDLFVGLRHRRRACSQPEHGLRLGIHR